MIPIHKERFERFKHFNRLVNSFTLVAFRPLTTSEESLLSNNRHYFTVYDSTTGTGVYWI